MTSKDRSPFQVRSATLSSLGLGLARETKGSLDSRIRIAREPRPQMEIRSLIPVCARGAVCITVIIFYGFDHEPAITMAIYMGV